MKEEQKFLIGGGRGRRRGRILWLSSWDEFFRWIEVVSLPCFMVWLA